MTRLPVVDAKKMERLLLKLGFEVVRQKGSHRSFRHPDGRYTLIPIHQGTDLPRPTIREILRQIGISVEEYNSHLMDL